ncbi:MAG: phosphatidylserine/phosphatidylglycerophosphate/cardiolipin synthase family protein [Bdellovibrionales bacterium]|nr:phosphatidylserine/phosphatidylglycerophosphate/cardiolipin synthase family protein [Bdellovibrionales bacterium]
MARAGARLRPHASAPAVERWISGPFLLRLPAQLRRAVQNVKVQVGDFRESGNPRCARWEEGGRTLQVNAACAGAEDLSWFASAAGAEGQPAPTRLQGRLVQAAVEAWGRTAPRFRDRAARREVSDQDFFQSPITLGVNIDQHPDAVFLDFWYRATWAVLTDPQVHLKHPGLTRYLMNGFLEWGELRQAERVDLDALAAQEAAESGTRGRVRHLVDPAEALYARMDLIRQARKTIHTGYFTVWNNDVFGRQFLGLLLQKARAGVKVKLIVDGRGFLHTRNDWLQELVEAGAEVKVWNPVLNSRLSILGSLVAYHDKILLVDGKSFITGGRNIGDRYFLRQGEKDGRVFWDTDVAVEFDRMPIALLQAFNSEFYAGVAKSVPKEMFGNWRSREPEMMRAIRALDDRVANETLSPETLRWHPEVDRMKSLVGKPAYTLWTSDEQVPVRVLDNFTRFGAQKQLSNELFRMMDEAESEILIQNPYLVLTPECGDRLEAAARRGVKVRFSVTSPTSTDSFLTQSVLTFEWQKIAAKVPGSEIHAALGPEQLHAKIFVFDRKVAVVGSYNMDAMSQDRNSEIALEVNSPAYAGEVAAEIDRFIREQSVHFDPVTGKGPEQIPNSDEEIERLEFYYSIARWVRPLL